MTTSSRSPTDFVAFAGPPLSARPRVLTLLGAGFMLGFLVHSSIVDRSPDKVPLILIIGSVLGVTIGLEFRKRRALHRSAGELGWKVVDDPALRLGRETVDALFELAARGSDHLIERGLVGRDQDQYVAVLEHKAVFGRSASGPTTTIAVFDTPESQTLTCDGPDGWTFRACGRLQVVYRRSHKVNLHYPERVRAFLGDARGRLEAQSAGPRAVAPSA
ncbi:MAG: hypothetical protein WBV82_22115 [Myxococcaceae bacterium]